MAWVVLFSWPVFAAVFFRLWDLPKAIAATFIFGYLFLPEQTSFDLPVLPALGKGTVPAIAAFVLTWLAVRNPQNTSPVVSGWLPRDRVSLVLMGLMIFGAFGTVLTNLQPVSAGPVRLPAMRLYDAFSIAMATGLALIPFVIARKAMATADAQRTLLLMTVMAATAYAFLALWEIRMSPQLNRQVYGFFPHAWAQHVRAGGFRPIVFMGHGLKLGIFLSVAAVAAFGLARYTTDSTRYRYIGIGLLLVGTIFLSKVIGAFAITVLILPFVIFLPRHLQVLMATGIAVCVLAFPALRNMQLVPTASAVALAEKVSVERAESLEFRFDNEDLLLDRAKEKSLFGWGGWGRNRIYDERGEDISVTDGYWVILFGQGGWVGYIGEMGLLCWSILALALRGRDKIDGLTAVLMLAMAANLIDLLPNAGLSPLTWLMAGALIGRLEYTGKAPAKAHARQDTPMGQPTYGRSFARTNGSGPEGPPGYRRNFPEHRRKPLSPPLAKKLQNER